MASVAWGSSCPRGSSTGTQSGPGQDPGYKFPGCGQEGGLGQAGTAAGSCQPPLTVRGGTVSSLSGRSTLALQGRGGRPPDGPGHCHPGRLWTVQGVLRRQVSEISASTISGNLLWESLWGTQGSCEVPQCSRLWAEPYTLPSPEPLFPKTH